MLDSKQLPEVKKHLELLKSQLSLFETKIKDTPEIEPGEKDGPEEERVRLLSLVASHQENLIALEAVIENSLCKNAHEKADLFVVLESLSLLDSTFGALRVDVEKTAEEQYACKLEIYRQEILKTIGLILDPFDFIIPNIRFELAYLEKFYRDPMNSAGTVIPEINSLIENLEEHEITLNAFFNGAGAGDRRVLGYNELRVKNKVFSRFQFYENSPESYRQLNDIYYEICKTMESFLKDKRSEPELGKYYFQVKDKGRPISKMSDIFETGFFLTALAQKSQKKYSYCDEVRRTTGLLQEFNEIKKSLIVYNDAEISRTENILMGRFTQTAEKDRLRGVMEEVNACVKDKTIPFAKLDEVFSKLLKKDFNVVVQEKDADDITIVITPHHERKYGRDILHRINIIIHEIDFWYPPEAKQLLFQNIARITEKIQADEPVDKKEFVKMMQGYDKELETSLRLTYPDKIRELASVYTAFKKTFADKIQQEKLMQRLANKGIWEAITPDVESVNKNLVVVSSDEGPLKKNVNKFPFLKTATEQISQVLYDLSMQLFVMFGGVDGRSITNMTNILSTYNEFHDIPSLWASFSHYFKKNNLPNLSVNEQTMYKLTKDVRCQKRLKEIFEREE